MTSSPTPSTAPLKRHERITLAKLSYFTLKCIGGFQNKRLPLLVQNVHCLGTSTLQKVGHTHLLLT